MPLSALSATIDIDDDGDEDIHVLQVVTSQKAQRRLDARRSLRLCKAASPKNSEDIHVLRVRVSQKAQRRLASRLKRKLPTASPPAVHKASRKRLGRKIPERPAGLQERRRTTAQATSGAGPRCKDKLSLNRRHRLAKHACSDIEKPRRTQRDRHALKHSDVLKSRRKCPTVQCLDLDRPEAGSSASSSSSIEIPIATAPIVSGSLQNSASSSQEQGIDDYFPDQQNAEDCNRLSSSTARLVPRVVQLTQLRRTAGTSSFGGSRGVRGTRGSIREVQPSRQRFAPVGPLHVQGELAASRPSLSRASFDSTSARASRLQDGGSSSSSSAPAEEPSVFLFVEQFMRGMAPTRCSCCADRFHIGELRLGYTPQAQGRVYPRWIHTKCAQHAGLLVEPGIQDVAFSPRVHANEQHLVLDALSRVRNRQPNRVQLQRWSYVPATMQNWEVLTIPCPLPRPAAQEERIMVDSVQVSPPIPADTAEAELGHFLRASRTETRRNSSAGWVDLNEIPLLTPLEALHQRNIREFAQAVMESRQFWQAQAEAEPMQAFSDEQINRREGILLQLPEEVLEAEDRHAAGSEAGTNQCAICQEAMSTGEIIRRLPCAHIFHRDCIDRWLLVRSTCPLDNRQVDEMLRNRI